MVDSCVRKSPGAHSVHVLIICTLVFGRSMASSLILDSVYTREKIQRMEKPILNRLQWNLAIRAPYFFFVLFAAAVTSSDLKDNKEIGIVKALHD